MNETEDDYYCGFRWEPQPGDAEPDGYHECSIPLPRHERARYRLVHRCSCEATTARHLAVEGSPS